MAAIAAWQVVNIPPTIAVQVDEKSLASASANAQILVTQAVSATARLASLENASRATSDVLIRARTSDTDVKLLEIAERAAKYNDEAQYVSLEQTGRTALHREGIIITLTQVFYVLAEMATFVEGDYDKRSRSSSLQKLLGSLIKRLHSATAAALSFASESFERLGQTEVKLLALRDSSLNTLKIETNEYLELKKAEVVTKKAQLTVLSEQFKTNERTLAEVRESLRRSQRDLQESRDSADAMQAGNILLWIFCWPAGLATQLAVTDRLKDACSKLQEKVDLIMKSAKTAEGNYSQSEAKLNQLQAEGTQAAMLAAQMEDMFTRVQGMMQFAENLRQHFTLMKTKAQAMETAVGALDAQSSATGYSTFKKQKLIEDIFDCLHLGMCDSRLVGQKNEIIRLLMDGDPVKKYLPGNLQSKLDLLAADEQILKTADRTARRDPIVRD